MTAMCAQGCGRSIPPVNPVTGRATRPDRQYCYDADCNRRRNAARSRAHHKARRVAAPTTARDYANGSLLRFGSKPREYADLEADHRRRGCQCASPAVDAYGNCLWCGKHVGSYDQRAPRDDDRNVLACIRQRDIAYCGPYKRKHQPWQVRRPAIRSAARRLWLTPEQLQAYRPGKAVVALAGPAVADERQRHGLRLEVAA